MNDLFDLDKVKRVTEEGGRLANCVMGAVSEAGTVLDCDDEYSRALLSAMATSMAIYAMACKPAPLTVEKWIAHQGEQLALAMRNVHAHQMKGGPHG